MVYGSDPINEAVNSRKQRYRSLIWIVDLSTKRKTLIASARTHANSDGDPPEMNAALSPDGRYIAYFSLTHPRQVVVQKL